MIRNNFSEVLKRSADRITYSKSAITTLGMMICIGVYMTFNERHFIYLDEEAEHHDEELSNYNWDLGRRLIKIARPLLYCLMVSQILGLAVFLRFPKVA